VQIFFTRINLFIGLMLILICGLASAGDTPLTQAHKLLSSGKYDEAYRQFSELYRDNFSNPKTAPQFLFYKAKAAYYAGLLDDGLADFQKLIGDFPQSPFVPYAYFFSGNILYRQNNPDDAAAAYLNSYRISNDDELDALVCRSLGAAVGNAGSPLFEKINIDLVPEQKRCNLAAALAEALIKLTNYQSAYSLLENCQDSTSLALKTEAGQMLRQQVEIGLVLPLSGELQKFGESVLDGAMLKIEEYNRESGGKVTPVIYDTKGESVEAGKIIQRLSAEGAGAAIGPLTSEETAVASAALSCRDLPLIAPAASQGGLTDLSSTCFQLQPSLDWQGYRMAEYAVRKLGFDTAAVITLTSPDNLRMAQAFADRFKELGGVILGVEYIRLKETDFGSLIFDLKAMASGNMSGSLTYINEKGDTLEPKEVPVNLECIYIPAEAAQLQLLLPQINFYNLQTTYLGGEGWGDKDVYQLGGAVTKSSYFTSGRIDSDLNEYLQTFRRNFKTRYGQEPGHLEALGYDAAALVCRALSSGHFSRIEIKHYLETMTDYVGPSGAVSFGDKHENIIMPIYTIENGLPRQIEF
jgi:branched-chain amino acid transport system substrate-binding protein